MRPDLVSLLAGDAALALRQLRDLPDDELADCPADFLERGARHMHAASYSAHVVARRFSTIARLRREPR